MRSFLLGCLFIFIYLDIHAQPDSVDNRYRKDFDFFWETVKQNYAYWDKKKTNWEKVKQHYTPAFDTITSTRNFILLLEKVFNEIYDHHASLSSNTQISQRLVPSGTDIWAEFIGNKPVITEVRLDFGADRCGLKAGMEIIAVNDISLEKAIQNFLPLSFSNSKTEPRNYALRLAVAGKFTDDRKISVRDGSTIKHYYPDRPVALLKEYSYAGPIESKTFPGNIGYIRINNRLWDNKLIPLFDSVLRTLKNTRALVLDLRETPSGGNTTVARAILGSFISKEGFYQKHDLAAEERIYGVKRSWMELVTPREYVYTKPLVILVNHWTGSVGEGITIGFDAFKRATIIGTTLARLNGAVYSYQMPNTNIGFSFPVEKLFHINGRPRENYKPAILVDMVKQKKDDLILLKALTFLRGK